MDPRLKLRYYEDNNWEDFYITEAKEIVTKVWENEYKMYDSVIEPEFEIDELFSHFFKKRKVCHKDELVEYLKESEVPYTTDVLQWWKVYFIINYK